MHNYLITCLVNGKIYNGCTTKKNLNRYFRQKISDATTRSNPRGIPLYHAIRKYGVDNFVCESLFQPKTRALMFALEIALIRITNSRDRNVGYNVTAGGEGAVGVKKSEASKKAASERMKGKKLSLGRKCSQEEIVAMRERMLGNTYGLGRKPSDTQQAALTANSFANKTPEEFKILHDVALEARREKGWIVTEEHKAKISASTKGKPKSEETKRRMREAAAKRTPEYKSALSALANKARNEKLSPEERSRLAKIGSDAALEAKRKKMERDVVGAA